jgi:hypothetical protein
MRIHALTTGTVRVKHSFLFASAGIRRQLDLFLPGTWSEPLPIHCWAVEHDGRLLLIDSGESATVRNVPFARFEVDREQELPGAFAEAGLSLEDDPRPLRSTPHHLSPLARPRVRRAAARWRDRQLTYQAVGQASSASESSSHDISSWPRSLSSNSNCACSSASWA